MADVFLSYAREDIGVAEKLAQFLANNGLDVWWDRRLVAGDDLNEVIEGELEKARSAIVLWSPHSVRSHWVRGEAQAALDLVNPNIAIAVVVTDPVTDTVLRGNHAVYEITVTNNSVGLTASPNPPKIRLSPRNG